ncbi:MAG: glycosyltransferase family 2 protein [Pseudomonadota bacterium]
MKLIIQIPCYNEAGQLPETLAALPRHVEGFDCVEWLVIDDGSSDGTAEVARAHGVDHIVRLPANQGLANAFMTGLDACLRQGADVIVNTDADNQYDARCIPDLTAPVLDGRAQIVIGARPIDDIAHFSALKRRLQKAGSAVVRLASGVAVADAPSGFRAIHRDAAVRLHVFNRHTYTLETIIQAGHLGITVLSVPVTVNPPTRESRLIRSVAQYVLRSGLTIFRIFVLYRPFRFFALVALLLALPGVIAFGRFVTFYLLGDGDGRVQSLVIGSALLSMAAVAFVGGLLADLTAANRKLLTEMLARQFERDLREAALERDGANAQPAPARQTPTPRKAATPR